MTRPVHDALHEGAIVLQQWQLVRALGEGGMGSVWEARSLQRDGRAAIKFLSRQHLRDSRLHTRFQREARAIRRIDSPHVLRILDHGVFEDETPFIVTELLEGEDLRRLLEREQRLGVAEAAEILDQLCRGLHAVHAAGLVHRDIKPDNVHIGQDPDGRRRVKLLDFGVVKQLSGESFAMTAQNMVVGTAHYLSPEQITSPNGVDHRADIWALGVLVHRMLSGALPYDADGWPALCLLLMNPPPASACAVRPELPSAVDDWLSRTLNADREQRFQSVEAAREAFARIARDHTSGVMSRSTTVPARARPAARLRSGRRRWAPRTLMVLLLLVFASLLALRLGRRVAPRHAANPQPPLAAGADEAVPAATVRSKDPLEAQAAVAPVSAALPAAESSVQGPPADGAPAAVADRQKISDKPAPVARPRVHAPRSAEQGEPDPTPAATARKYRGF